MSRVSHVGLFPSIQALLGQYFAVPSDLSRSGVQLLVLGASLSLLRSAVSLLTALLDRTLISRTQIESREQAFAWLSAYLGAEAGTTASHFTIAKSEEDGPLSWVPAPGYTFLWLDRPVLVHRELLHGDGDNLRSALGNEKSRRLEQYTISTIARTPDLLHGLIERAREVYIDRDRARTIVFAGSQYGNWQRLHSRPIRPLSTVILPEHLLRELMKDVKRYLDPLTEKWYAERGIPYRRGYLFSGPPGTGKTSLVGAIAGEFKLGVYVVSLAGKGMNDDTVMELLANMPRRSILLFEDIDVAFPNRKTSEVVSKDGGVTSSGLLNALDGVAAQEGRIVILTTNYRERLDAALIRPGRVDMSIEFALATESDARSLFDNFFGKKTALAGTFAVKTGGQRFSIAALQGYLMTHKDDPQGAIDGVDSWVTEHSA